MNLLNIPVTTAVASGTVSAVNKLLAGARNLAVQANFVYGSGGTSFDAYVQTSLDNGVTWIDVAQFHFTTSSARFVFNLNAQTAVTAQYTATDGTLSANTAKDGILGSQFRVKYQSVGTYAGSTSLTIDAVTDQVA